jgi:hypothetical protein
MQRGTSCTKQCVIPIVVIAVLIFNVVSCSKNTSPTQVQQTTPHQLTAVPPSAAVGVGTSQNIAISGGTPPYSVASGPSAIATAQLTNPDSLVATLTITGVTVATASTSITVRDSAAVKNVAISIGVH